MKQRRGLSSIIGMLFFVIILVSAISYFTYGIKMVDKVNDEVIVKGIESVDKIKENFEIVSATIDNGKFNITIQNTGPLPINFKRLWVDNVTDNTWPLQNFTVNKVASPGQVLNNIGKDLNLFALESQAYSMKLITQRGNSEGISINSVSQGSLDLKFFALPSTVSDKFHTTLLLTVTNNMTKNNMLLNLKPVIVNIQKTATAQETLISPATPNEHTSLAKGDTAYFSWIYQISGVEGDSVTFTASVENSYPGNEASASVTVNKVLLADKSGTSLEALGLGTNTLNDSVLIFHAETDQTPNGAFQMFSGASDGGVDGTRLQLESTTPSFFTKNGTDDITVPAGLWTASLQLQSEAMPGSLIGDDEDLIFHFEDGEGVDPDNSEGDSDRDLEGCGATSYTQEISTGSNDAEENNSGGSNDGDVNISGNDLEMPDDGGTNQIIGLRFTGVNIPAGSTITSASIEFTADETDSSTVTLDIWGEDVDDASTFTGCTNECGDISGRTKTSSQVTWSNIPSWNNGEQGPDTTTPDLSAIIQEVIDRPGWSNGNNIVFIIEGSGTNERVAESVEGGPNAPTLTINWSTTNSGNPEWQDGSGPHASGAYYFDGINACFRSQNNITNSDDNDIDEEPDTTSLWFRSEEAVTSEQHLVYWDGDGSCPACDYYKIALDNTGKVLFEFDTDTSTSTGVSTCLSTSEYDDDTWYHVTAVRGANGDSSNSDDCTLYIEDINGNNLETITVSYSYGSDRVDADGKWYVGSNKAENGNWFKGWIDDVMHWNGDGGSEFLGSAEAEDLAKTNYGTGAHKFDVWLDQTDKDGILIQNIYNSLQANFPFQDPKGLGDNDDNGYSVFNFTFNMPQVDVTAGERLNFSMNFIDSTSTWEALDLDMKIDDETLSPYPSFLEIQSPDNPFSSYFIYDNDFDVEVWITNTGANGIYFIQQGTRISLNGTNGAYAAMIKSVNGTGPLYQMSYDRDSLYIPIASKVKIYFHPPTDHPSVTPIVGTRIPAGTYTATTWLEGYDDQGESFARSVKLGSVLVVD